MSYYVKKKQSFHIVIEIDEHGAHNNRRKFKTSGAAHTYAAHMQQREQASGDE